MHTSSDTTLAIADAETGGKQMQISVQVIEHEHNAEMKHSIIKRTVGSLSVTSTHTHGFKEVILERDSYIQVIDGNVMIDINGRSSTLKKGDGILIPAHHPSHIRAHGKFALLLTVINN